MNKFFNMVIDLWLREFGNKSIYKIKLACESGTSLPTVYNVCNKESYNTFVITQMWKDLENVIDDEDKLQIMIILNLF